MNGLENPGVLDAFAHDARENRLVLAMYETRPWNGGDRQLFQLQEKLNAYLSFVLDGEMREAYPQFADKPVCIQLRTVYEPGEHASSLLRRVREQLELQEIQFEIVQISDDEVSSSGGCGCGSCNCH